jgi:ATP-dependent exoDNAse (exonuclease V) alpha subunit
MELNKDQQIAYDYIRNYIITDSEYDFVVFKGFAGTGKSYTLSRIAESLKNVQIGMSAPTHKAVRVLKDDAEDSSLYIYNTIHSFLGLKQVIKNNGDILFEPEAAQKYRKKLKVDDIDVLIIDESSMLNSSLLKQILDYYKKEKKFRKFRLIFTGDPLQCPPVNEEQSLVFNPSIDNHYKVLHVDLTMPMRQALDNPILAFATDIRNDINNTIEVPDTIKQVTSTDMEQIILNWFDTHEFRANANYCKILAWTNKVVNEYNIIVRNIILNNPTESIIVGDKLVADASILDRQGKVQFNNNDEFTVTHVRIDEIRIVDDYYRVFLTQVRNEEKSDTIVILHSSSIPAYLRRLEDLKTRALLNGASWKDYYAFIEKFAQIKYNYALTVHKSQGSSFTNCVVIDSNIKQNKIAHERNRLRYVAMTRAKNKLLIL